MFHLALYQPCIAPNTGNIIRLAANTGCDYYGRTAVDGMKHARQQVGA